MGKKKKAIMKGWKKFANHPAVRARQKPEEVIEEQKAPEPEVEPEIKEWKPEPKIEAPEAVSEKVPPWPKNKKYL